MTGYLAAGVLLVLLLAAGAGYWRGYDAGADHERAQQVERANQSIVAEQQRAAKAIEAAKLQAKTLRARAAKQERVHAQTTQQLQATIARLEKSHKCLSEHVSAGILRQLDAARDSAARRAATGTATAAVPITTRPAKGGNRE